MIDVRKLRLLHELDQRGTIAATAVAVNITPSAVSQQLGVLAREVGVRLLDPDGRRVRLTPAAHVLLRHAEEVFAELERAQADLAAFAEGEVGTIGVAAFATAITGIVVPAITALRQSRPRLDVVVQDVEQPACFDGLAAGDWDIVVAMAYPGAPPGDGRFTRVPLFDDVLDIVLPCDHPYADADEVPLSALAGDHFVGSTVGSSCGEILIGACAAAGFVPTVRHRSGDYAAVFGLVGAGCGVGLLPRLSGLTSTSSTVIRPIAGAGAVRPLFAAIRRGSDEAPHVAAVLAAIRESARAWTAGREMTVAG